VSSPVGRVRRVRAANGGFSLFELLVVIAIIGVLAAVSVPKFGDFRAAAYDARSQQDLRNLASAQELFRASNDVYAGRLDALESFEPSEDVLIRIEAADRNLFRASAFHPSGRHRYAWDSSASPALSAQQIR
jgi:prepilin-type N-terminal cleavage/methylation domain-containing protein